MLYLIYKVLFNHLKPYLHKLIGHSQSALIPKRSIHENINIAQKAAHLMFSFEGKRVKINLDKAFNRLSLIVIIGILPIMNFSSQFIQPI